jgi:hypothetical protein
MMTFTTRTTAPLLFAAALAALSLTGCAPDAEPDRDPRPDDSGSGEQQPCIVGTWDLDVLDYETQSIEYFAELGLPIEDFAMGGQGTIRFTADGLVAGEIELAMTGMIVADEVRVPVDTTSGYSASGDWSPGDDLESIDLANWVNLPNSGVPADPDAPPVPAIDYTDIPAVAAHCTETTLVLQAPGAPFYSRWHR